MTVGKETYLVRDGYFYTKDHEWVRKKEGDNTLLVGITDYAAKMLHDIVYVSLPQEGTTFKTKDVFGQIESVKTVADVYMPISGNILKTNQRLAKEPELVANSTYEDGWMLEVDPTNYDEEVKNLLSPEAYKRYVSEIQESDNG